MRKSRLSWEKKIRLIEYFVSGATARTAAALVGVNKSTLAYYFHRLREIIAQAVHNEMPLQGKLKWMKVISVAGARESVAERGCGESPGLWNSQAWGPR